MVGTLRWQRICSHDMGGSMGTPVKIISVGGGWVVNHRHLYALRNSGLFRILGVLSNDSHRAEATARRHGIRHFGTEIDFSIDWQSEAEAVMIGTVPHAHHSMIRAALQEGKHVLTEKPMTVDPTHGREMVELAREKNCVLAVVHNFQFSRAAQAFRRDLADGRMGALKAAYGVQLCNHARKIPAWCDDLPLGLFYDEAPHFYYTLRWIGGGEIQLLNATVWKTHERRNTPRLVTAEYRSPEGTPLFLHINFESSITEWHVTVVGEKATVDIDIWRDIYVRFPNDGVHSAKDIVRTSMAGALQHFWGVFTGGLRHITHRHLYGNEEVVRRFYRAIHGEDSLAGMSAAEGLRVVEMQHELIQKARYYD